MLKRFIEKLRLSSKKLTLPRETYLALDELADILEELLAEIKMERDPHGR